jgi:putative integral membrane protein (TIGR02587 family)
MSRSKSAKGEERTVAESLQEYGRGLAGGLMFSLPLLYTMEVWWTGFIAHPWRLLIYVMATFVLLLGYNRYAGLRRDASRMEVAIDSVEEMGIGLLIAGLILFLLGRITFEMPINEIGGLIVVEAMTVAIGVSVGTAQLGAGGKEDEGLRGDSQKKPQQSPKKKPQDKGSEDGARAGDKEIHFGGQMVLAICGAVLFAANLAPTEEIVVVALETSWLKIVGLALVSLLMGSLILHYSEFKGAQELVRRDGLSAILLGTVITYAIALATSALILWFFGRFDGVTLYAALAQTVALGVAATLGASAGRLLLQ